MKKQAFTLPIRHPCPCATTKESIATVSLKALQRAEKQLLVGFMDSNCTQGLRGLIFADKGYISHTLFKTLYRRGLKLITGIRRNIKNYLMPLIENIMLRKRFLIETVFDILKVHMNLSHTRHRSPLNACVNILSCLVSYQLNSSKTSF